MAIQTTSFKIARYILFALVLILCIWIIVWTTTTNKEKAEPDGSINNVIQITSNNPTSNQ